MTTVTSEFVSIELTETHALLSWNRIAKRNAFSREMLEAIESSLESLNAEHARLPIILSGGPYFSAGADAGEMASEPEAYREGLGRLHIAIGDLIAAHEAPVISAIEGFAFGGGLVIAACADIVIAADDAKLGLTEARVGLVGGLGVVDNLVGRLAAARLVMLGEVITAQEGLSLGLVSRLVEPSTALATAEQVTAELAELNPDAWTMAKRIIRRSPAGVDRREEEADANQWLLTSSDNTKARVARFRKVAE